MKKRSSKRSSLRKKSSGDSKQRGKLAAHYVIMEKLGRGNFAVVRKVKRKSDGKFFAAKIITKKAMKPRDLKMLGEEVNILKQLSHPNINRLIETFDTKNHLYIVLELLSGENLFENIVKQQSYTEYDAAKVVMQVARACEYMHPRGVIHRDLKPENLVYLDANKDHICVTDFGLSKSVENEGDLMKTACGTPAFVAPEILRQEKYDSQVDMWSLGVILYTMLCGYPPFIENNLPTLYRTIKSGKVKFEKRYWKNISLEARDCVCGLLTVDASKRLNPVQLLQHKWLNLTTVSKVNLFNSEGYDRRFKRYLILTKLQRGVDTILFLNRLKRFSTLVMASESGRSNIKLKGLNEIERDLNEDLESKLDENAADDLNIYE